MTHDITDGMYCFTSSAGITYRMPYEIMTALKVNFKMFESMESWYASLSKAEKKAVIREGLPKSSQDGDFYPDPIPDDF